MTVRQIKTVLVTPDARTRWLAGWQTRAPQLYTQIIRQITAEAITVLMQSKVKDRQLPGHNGRNVP